MTVIKEDNIYNGTVKFDNCDLTITVVLKTYDNHKKFYYVDYQWNYKENDMKYHPMHYDEDFIENHNDGDIIVQNELSDKLIEFLIMNNDDLQEKSGTVHVIEYRKQIIKTISLFWD